MKFTIVFFRVILIIFLLISSLSSCEKNKECSYINDYYQKVYSAEEAFYRKDYQLVYDILNELSSTCDIINQQGVYELNKFAESASIIGKKDKAVELIQQLILQGTELDRIKENESYLRVVNSEEWEVIKNNYDSLHLIYLKGINHSLRKEVIDILSSDQRERRLLKTTANKDSLWAIINKTDSINENKYKEIIAKHGYPYELIIGSYKINNRVLKPHTPFFHFDDYDYWVPTLKGLIDKGEAPARTLGVFVDSYQRRVDSPKRFIYGIYDNITEDEIIDFNQLDNRRVSIGLRTISAKKRIDSLRRVFYGL